jgi:NAD-dependent deacetylase
LRRAGIDPDARRGREPERVGRRGHRAVRDGAPHAAGSALLSGPDPDALARARALLGGARRLVVFTGAGVSAESGIPTFRDALEGLWARFEPERLATEAGFRADPALVWRWYAERRERVARAEPNAAHRAIAESAQAGRAVTVVTQNVDGLHQRAGSREVIELHGSIVRAKCLEGCGPAPAGWEREARVPPTCPACGAPLRPDVVWFGETLPAGAFEHAQRLAEEADAMLVVGTSGLVQPAASLPWAAVRRRRPGVVVDPNPTELDALATVCVRGSAVSVVPAILRAGPPPGGACAP